MTNLKQLTLLPCIIILLNISACSTNLPNTKPFVDASLALENASQTSFNELNNSFKVIIDNEVCLFDRLKKSKESVDNKEKTLKKYQIDLDKIKSHESAQLAILQAVGQYASNLDGIVQNAQKEDDKIKQFHKVFDDAFALADKNSIFAGPYAPMISASAEAATIFDNLIANLRQDINNKEGIKKISVALKESGNAIGNLAKSLNFDFNSYINLSRTKLDPFIEHYYECHQSEYDYHDCLSFKRDEAINKVMGFESKSIDKTCNRIPNAAMISSIGEQLQYDKPYYDVLETNKNLTVNRLLLIPAILQKGIDTLEELAKAYKELGQQIEQDDNFDFNKLESYAQQLATLGDKINKLQSTTN